MTKHGWHTVEDWLGLEPVSARMTREERRLLIAAVVVGLVIGGLVSVLILAVRG